MTSQSEKIQSFIDELAGFASVAEDTLKKIEENKGANKGLFKVFSKRMLAIRGTALQLSLPHIANIAGLGEEIALKGETAETNRHVRKCVGSLWDALTTIKYLLINHQPGHLAKDTSEEQEILVRRLEATLKAFGGARETVSADEIEKLLRSRG